MYLKELQRTPKVLDFDNMRTHNRWTGWRVASRPCRPADGSEPGPEVPRSASKCLKVPQSALKCQANLQFILCPKYCKKWIWQFWAARAPNRSLDLARPGPHLPRLGIAATQILQAVLNLQIICDTFTTKFSPQQMCKFCFGRTRHQQRIGTEHSWLLGSLPDRALPLPAVRNGTDRRRRPATQRDDGQAHTICNSSGGPRPTPRVNDR